LNGIQLPPGWRIDVLSKSHRRRSFQSGHETVDLWLKQSALQSQKKHLTATKVLLDDGEAIAGYYTLATSQIDFSDLPFEIAKALPRRRLPVATLAWFGICQKYQSQGLGKRLLAIALRDCHVASQTFSFIAVVLDCVDENAKRFYKHFDFEELPGYPMRLYLSFKRLDQMMSSPSY
jgi:GNAT superfamily N-acetyltransferase